MDVRIFDTTLRDGEQSPGVSLTEGEKLDIARQLARLGVDVIEAGFPVNSPAEVQAVANIAREVRGPVICALARTHPTDVAAAAEALKGAEAARIHVFTSASPVHLQHLLKKGEDEVIEASVAAIRAACRFTADVEFSGQDCGRAERDFIVRLYGAAIAAGATTINIPDTVGYAQPEEFADLIAFVRRAVPGGDRVAISVHTHDDLGLAVANALAGVRAGADQVECAVNGIGERAGNCSLEEVVMALATRRDLYGRSSGVKTTELARTSRLVAALTGMAVPGNKAVVGANAFAHESGIHQDGILKERTTYEIMRPEDVGLAGTRLVLGKHSGRHALRRRLEELGYDLDEAAFRRTQERLKEMAAKKQEIGDLELEAIVRSETAVDEAAPYRLEHLQVMSGTRVVPTATVRLTGPDGTALLASADGDGPVDATYRAIQRAVGAEFTLVDYSLRAAATGGDAVGEASVRVRDAAGREAIGRGASTDVIEASAQAFVGAIARLAEPVRPRQAGGEARAAGAATGVGQ
ncbi:MAG TPA: 2-isopropylmalate synthase [Bacillota bacterium]|nr:2-isopropylmalate synthase [Bacillota bacterium]